MRFYPEPEIRIRDKVKVVLDLRNNATKKGLDHATGVDTTDLPAKKDFIALKAEVDKLYINKLVNVPTILNNLKTKVNNLDLGKLKAVPMDLTKLSNVVHNDIVKNKKLNTVQTKQSKQLRKENF